MKTKSEIVETLLVIEKQLVNIALDIWKSKPGEVRLKLQAEQALLRDRKSMLKWVLNN